MHQVGYQSGLYLILKMLQSSFFFSSFGQKPNIGEGASFRNWVKILHNGPTSSGSKCLAFVGRAERPMFKRGE